MKRFAVTILALLSMVFLPGMSSAHHNSLSICGVNGGEVIDAFVDDAFPEKPGVYFDRVPMVINDVRCGTEEYSFNIAIVVIELPQEGTGVPKNTTKYFGIFQIKLSMKNRTILYSAIVPWEDISAKDDQYLLNIWCGFIKNSYPNQQKENGCSQ
ncbi:MAG: hypothetical protein A3G49_02150 [Candidatus Sungbacteria bacterium RIFCSPLOWO2_12_FULL_41_11]|uniref:CopC domain-containing protein n=1 Tax=Candidatus Sungbacteria bacterium RIFCSPLOWO2_12_FULL_41_11 TaxID=1802286 RepID=A0A1G2LNP4_9BACT|nr:MAG: hypothetical protein UV01_C0004G0021 [Parcubacteria group bacterium GW2011_GWA2_42_14]OHA13144.1 MAG: hypothetical protein A3G49_02150 [Candidatus Sungbacteria bacterium RIFCSPLOWO2_12_FULL_41_11]